MEYPLAIASVICFSPLLTPVSPFHLIVYVYSLSSICDVRSTNVRPQEQLYICKENKALIKDNKVTNCRFCRFQKQVVGWIAVMAVVINVCNIFIINLPIPLEANYLFQSFCISLVRVKCTDHLEYKPFSCRPFWRWVKLRNRWPDTLSTLILSALSLDSNLYISWVYSLGKI